MSETYRDGAADNNATSKIGVALWVAQCLLALVFLFAGGAKLVLPAEKMQGPVAIPILFTRFLGVAEVLGATGLILPSLLGIKPGLTPLAACGLVLIMIGATTIHAATGDPTALFTLVIGILATFVAYGRWRLAPISSAPEKLDLRRAG